MEPTTQTQQLELTRETLTQLLIGGRLWFSVEQQISRVIAQPPPPPKGHTQ
jgi:hypothetical protein